MSTMIATSSEQFDINWEKREQLAFDQRRTVYHGDVDGEWVELIQDGNGWWHLYNDEGDFVDDRGIESTYQLGGMSPSEYEDVIRRIQRDIGLRKGRNGLPL